MKVSWPGSIGSSVMLTSNKTMCTKDRSVASKKWGRAGGPTSREMKVLVAKKSPKSHFYAVGVLSRRLPRPFAASDCRCGWWYAIVEGDRLLGELDSLSQRNRARRWRPSFYVASDRAWPGIPCMLNARVATACPPNCDASRSRWPHQRLKWPLWCPCSPHHNPKWPLWCPCSPHQKPKWPLGSPLSIQERPLPLFF